ncbi:uncharacterized protein J4E84_009255 [Alternaria hordeiaustralica]|uniref:uncharacterized protein n=1 Tax=Alternaria hordeiaustralica TaxID=1187925 RepID=UPI0020C52FBA|nr:uncharacterized protein J4E84_009255 [Alternaria hordeiaustralica]KAI4676955.1 hypothetical protein J4E84_009255 [Alternaria hordeiaustralica]
MAPRKKTKRKANKRVKVTHPPVPDAGEQRTRGKRNRPVIPDSDDELATEDETEDGSPVPSQTHINPGLNDVRRWIAYYVVQYYVVASRNKKLIHDATTQ